MIRLKRVYEEPSKDDGFRILVERLWPRALTKERAAVDLWLKDIAPSSELRTWFSHDITKWEQFRERYWVELSEKDDLINILKQRSKDGIVTFVYAAHDEKHNSAVALKAFLKKY
ncbi:MAG: DUF488 family protein [Actinobacteria bacterium]|nr:DUF488 family protein [Actinomycetota bacterium]